MIGLWTPPHFWSLALFRMDDYRSARVPMMPLVRGERVTKRQSAVYAALLVGASIALAWTRVVSARYLFIFSVRRCGWAKSDFRRCGGQSAPWSPHCST